MERQRTTALPAEAELARQMEYIREIRQENDRYFAETGIYLHHCHVRGLSGCDHSFGKKIYIYPIKKGGCKNSRLFLRGRSRKNVILWGRDHTLRYEVCP